MRLRRVKWLAAAGLGLVLAGYMAGRLHQHDTVAAYRTMVSTLEQMVTKYEAANASMWDALGAVARVETRIDTP